MSAVDCVNSEDPLFKHQNALALSGGEKKEEKQVISGFQRLTNINNMILKESRHNQSRTKFIWGNQKPISMSAVYLTLKM